MGEPVGLDLSWVYQNDWECYDDRILDLLAVMSLMLAYPDYGTETEREEVVTAVWHMLSYDAQIKYEVEKLEFER